MSSVVSAMALERKMTKGMNLCYKKEFTRSIYTVGA